MEPVTAPRALLRRGKRGAAAYVNGGCSNSESLKYLGELLDVLLSPETTIEDLETIEWCKWLMAGGKTPEEFSTIGKVTVYELHLSLEYSRYLPGPFLTVIRMVNWKGLEVNQCLYLSP
jgi:E3 ubiquitin-protein ligase UBR3